jgi:DNA-binding NarL/FixJ family response regulator
MTQQEVVLLVDDIPQSLGALCTELEGEGYTVLVAPDGAAALAQLDLVVPDAVLLDAMMPGMNGFDTCRRIKEQAAWAHVPIIFMTGLAETEDIVAGFAAGGVDYVVKPVRAPEVLARLATHVRNARVARLAREAVDLGGLGVMAIDSRSRIAWLSPQAKAWLSDYFGDTSQESYTTWLCADQEESKLSIAPGRWLIAQRLGEVSLGETMWLLRVGNADQAPPSRLASAALTPRETEVLSWIAKGKTNRDIADILGMSPRTVNKHLEHVFEKLGVETRSAAAAMASRELH